ncbi:trihelix transcription factor GTL1-like isoform X2 [Zingiber officinale]|uniref:trihelix transcription factor GTL1-like isoform X2 n=1 Tax=Zingiber officinale TaxID=94328 RepID=UPI001C4B5A00|nr:trihelix transcription factor GTL1-like isoform X2 [Zingiber officinale]
MQQKSGEGLQFQAEMSGSRPQGLVESTQPPPLPAAQQLTETPSPISSRPPPPPAPTPGAVNFDELGSAVAGAVGFLDDEEAERGGPSGSRWPKQETLALLKIRSEMDAAFRDATFKGPLWEEISRKLAELGYKRSSKKCKEKFENVHKYYKRTKEGRAGRQDGKTYRFFTQLEALHGRSGGGDATTSTAIAAQPITAEPPATFSFTTSPMSAPPAATRIQPFPISAAAPPLVLTPTRLVPEIGQQRLSSSTAVAGISFSSNSSFSSSSDSDSDEEMAEAGGNAEERKRKRGNTGRPARRQMMAFFEGLMRQVMERQEAMQQRFLEAIEKREQERMKREEAWLLQEMARLSREQELLVQERAMAASRDAAVISYLQKITGQSITLPTIPSATTLPLATSVVALTSLPSHNPPPAPPPPSNPPQPPPSLQKHEAAQRSTEITIQTSPASHLAPINAEQQEGRGPGSGGFDAPASSSRWPKTEVHALIKLRSELESRYQEAGPKGPLWDEISSSMQRLGYNRNSKRCKEKWENINKYFKKVKDSNKKRQEDSKTCPYFDQLDALYRRKQFGSAAGGSRSLAAQQQQEHLDTNPTKEYLPLQLHPPAPQDHGKNEKTNDGNSDTGGAVQVPTSNGGHTPSFIEEGMKKILPFEARRHCERANYGTKAATRDGGCGLR